MSDERRMEDETVLWSVALVLERSETWEKKTLSRLLREYQSHVESLLLKIPEQSLLSTEDLDGRGRVLGEIGQASGV